MTRHGRRLASEGSRRGAFFVRGAVDVAEADREGRTSEAFSSSPATPVIFDRGVVMASRQNFIRTGEASNGWPEQQ